MTKIERALIGSAMSLWRCLGSNDLERQVRALEDFDAACTVYAIERIVATTEPVHHDDPIEL